MGTFVHLDRFACASAVAIGAESGNAAAVVA
jgi:hypothetical protein